MMLLRSVAALALSASPLAAQAEARWTEVASDSTAVISIDNETVIAVGDSVYRAWERTASPQSRAVRVLARVDFDCRLRLTRAVTVVLPGYLPVRASDDDQEWREIVPSSTDETEWRQVCTRGGGAGAPR